MDHIELLNSIKRSLAFIEVQVGISNANNEFDINQHAENLFIPILDLLFAARLKNLNQDTKNNVSIDLFDESGSGIAFQVTSTTSTAKIIQTLESTARLPEKYKISALYFLMLKPKQKKYRESFINRVREIVGSKFSFGVYNNVIDLRDLYTMIKQANDFKLSGKVERLLRENFTGVTLFSDYYLEDFNKFKNNYYKACRRNFSRISFFGLAMSQKPKEVELYRLFVQPRFTIDNSLERKAPGQDELKLLDLINGVALDGEFEFKEHLLKSGPELEEENEDPSVFDEKAFESLVINNTAADKNFYNLFNGNNHFVLLGNPGSGKSSVIKYAICKMIDQDKQVFISESVYSYFPFRVELYKYNKSKKQKSFGFLQYISQLLQEDFQATISVEHLSKMLSRMPCLVFFDAMDEIFDVHERIAVRNDIENFTEKYPRVRVVVTSRYESYDEVSLSPLIFSIYKLSNFAGFEIEQYVDKLYSIESDDEEQKRKEIKECIRQLGSVEEEIKKNPLLLSLILLLYRNSSGMPTSKMAIYEGCTNTIVETRDSKEKSLGISLIIKNKASIFAALAFWLFTNEKEGKGPVRFEKVKNYIKQHLLVKLRYEDEVLADKAATQFLDYSKVRSIFLENRFTHKTFFEYYTAYYFYSNYYLKPEQRAGFLQLVADNMGNPSWSVIMELLLCKIDTDLIDNDIIDTIVTKQLELGNEMAMLSVLHIVRYLENISYPVVKQLIEIAVDKCVLAAAKYPEPCTDTEQYFFNALVAMVNNPMRLSILQSVFSNRYKSAGISMQLPVRLCMLEYSIVAEENSLQDSAGIDNEIDHPYVFILARYTAISSFQGYLDALAAFRARFGAPAVVKTYASVFRQAIFHNTHLFNWPLSYYLHEGSIKPVKKYRNLLEYISYPQLMEACNEKIPGKSVSLDKKELKMERKSFVFDAQYQDFLYKLM